MRAARSRGFSSYKPDSDATLAEGVAHLGEDNSRSGSMLMGQRPNSCSALQPPAHSPPFQRKNLKNGDCLMHPDV